VPASRLAITDDAIAVIVERYTREAGVRNLERRIASIARKTAGGSSSTGRARFASPDEYQALARIEGYPEEEMRARPAVGFRPAWRARPRVEPSSHRGDHGEGVRKLKLTGSLGDVMKESAEAALSFVKSRYAGEAA